MLLLENALGVFLVYLVEDEGEKEKEDEAGFTSFEKPVMGSVKPIGNTSLKDVYTCY